MDSEDFYEECSDTEDEIMDKIEYYTHQWLYDGENLMCVEELFNDLNSCHPYMFRDNFLDFTNFIIDCKVENSSYTYIQQKQNQKLTRDFARWSVQYSDIFEQIRYKINTFVYASNESVINFLYSIQKIDFFNQML